MKLSGIFFYICLPIGFVLTLTIVGVLSMLAAPTWIEYNEYFQEMPEWIYFVVSLIVYFGAMFVTVFILLIFCVFIVSKPKKQKEDQN